VATSGLFTSGLLGAKYAPCERSDSRLRNVFSMKPGHHSARTWRPARSSSMSLASDEVTTPAFAVERRPIPETVTMRVTPLFCIAEIDLKPVRKAVAELLAAHPIT
jgi:hypothetical protein